MSQRRFETPFVLRWGMFLACLPALASLASAQTTFAFSRQSISVGGNNTVLVVADVFGSPAADVIVLDAGAPLLRVVDIAAGGAVIVVPVGGIPYTAVAEDLNGDGERDLAVVTTAFNLRVWINGTGSVTGTTYAAATPNGGRLTARDMDLDGDRDLVIGRTIHWNDGAGAFPTSTVIASATAHTDWVPGDFDGDGDIDLATVFLDGPPPLSSLKAQIFRRDAGASYTLLPNFALPVSFFFGVQYAYFGVADMDGDTIDDLVTVASADLDPSCAVQVRSGGAGFAFVSQTEF